MKIAHEIAKEAVEIAQEFGRIGSSAEQEIIKVTGLDECIEAFERIEKAGKHKPKENILIEADRIINGDRKAQYGDQRLNFQKYGRIATEMLDAEELEAMKRGEITDTIVTKVMVAIKLGRESFKHKRDNLTDSCGYLAILNGLQE